MDAFEWEAFPKAIIVSDGKLACDTIDQLSLPLTEFVPKNIQNIIRKRENKNG